MLASVAVVAGHAVEHARMHETAMNALSPSSAVDDGSRRATPLFTGKMPDVPGYRFYSFYPAAEDVGGDYFGYIPLADGRAAIALGDVSGKSVSGALLMARVRRSALLSCRDSDARQSDRAVEPRILRRRFGHMFITFLMEVLTCASTR